jgi:hypothetical protein
MTRDHIRTDRAASRGAGGLAWLRALTVLLLATALLAVAAPAQAAEPAATPAAAPAAAGPAVPHDSGTGRRVVYSNSMQRVWLVGAAGTAERTYRVSGRKGTPRPGTYKVFSRSEKAFSTGGVTMRYMVRFAHGRTMAIGFHDIPRDRYGRPLQTEAQLGTYRSHGCVRQSTADAKHLYAWAPVGTKVVVLR